MKRVSWRSLFLPFLLVAVGVGAMIYVVFAPSSSSTPDVIVFTDNGFDKKKYDAIVGSPVMVRNESSRDLTFTGGSSPTSHDHHELDLGKLAPGASDTFTPNETGKLRFHDHANHSFSSLLEVRAK